MGSGSIDGDDATAEDQAGDATARTKRERQGGERGEGSDRPIAEATEPSPEALEALEDARLAAEPHQTEREAHHHARGTLLGRYVVLDILGEGGMGVVYAAYDPELDRKVAVKVLQAKPAGGSGTEGSEQAWLVREAQALARLAHPNVIAVHDVGTLPDDHVFVAMELVEGVTLREWLKTPRTWREVLPIMRAAGAGLAAAHAAGLVHRDFKPDNVLVGHDHRVRVMDFGLARLRPEDETGPVERTSDLSVEVRSPLAESLTVAGTVIGTPAYMAPEIYKGTQANAGTDQFAFGVALYEALYRVRPFSKRELKAGAQPKAPPEVGVPASIRRVVMRALSIDPAARFSSMEAMLAELARDPMARMRNLLLVAGAVVIVGGAVGATYAVNRRSTSLCTGAERRLAGVWDGAIRQAVGAAFDATKKPFAKTSFVGLGRALDGYTHEWTRAVTDSCEATRIRGEQTEDVLSLRQACLDQRLEELRALTKLLSEPDDALVEKGDNAVWALTPLSSCANIAVLRAPGVVPPELRARVMEINQKVADAKAEVIAGRYLPGLTAAKAAVDGAREIGYEPMMSEALVVRGGALLAVGNAEDATAAFTEATWAAIRGKRDDVAADSAMSAAMAESEVLGRPAEARIWIGLANAAAARVGIDRALSARLLATGGLVAVTAGDFVTAIAMHEKAMADAERLYGHDNPQLMSNELMLATTLTRAGAFGKATPHFEHGLALREASVGPDHPDVALILSNLGACYRHTGELKKSRAAFDRALALREKIYGKRSPMLIATLDNFGELMRVQGDYAGAAAMQERAIALCKLVPGTSHPTYHQLATDYGDTLIAAGRFADAHKLFEELFALEEAVKSPILPVSQSGRAELAIAERAWPEAMAFAEKAIAGFEAAGGADNPQLWRALTDLGRAKLGQGKPGEAKPLLERAIAVGEKSQIAPDDLAPTKALLAGLGK